MRIQRIAVAMLVSTGILAFGADEKKPARQTFLDTLNKGREVSISKADFAPQATAETVKPAAPATDTPARNPAVKPKTEPGVVASHFRIQVVAATSQDQVGRVKAGLASKINLPMTVVFEPPYYKLFAGDFTVRSEAENYLAQVKKLGYNDAWISRTAAANK